jgi:hypothetical protein
MPLRIGDLIKIIEASSIRLPRTGTGRNHQIVARDLETCIGDHFLKRDYVKGSDDYKHMMLRRAWTPMKAYRFNQLRPYQQEDVLQDDNEWLAERKINGWRMMITFIPNTTPRFWGGNLSTVNFLPTDYTKHIILKPNKAPYTKNYPATSSNFSGLIGRTCILDCEVTVKDGDEMLSDHASLIRVQEILGSNADRARRMQEEATLLFNVFDRIDPKQLMQPYYGRKLDAIESVLLLQLPTECALWQFLHVKIVAQKKKAYCHKIWKEGGEGVILKHKMALYTPGSRLRTHQIKVKRSHSDMVGDDIDAFITRTFETPEWSKLNLIGGVELSLYLKEGDELNEHVIAKVTSIPDHMRKQLTNDPEAWLGKVVVCDGQDLSARNRRLLHAKVAWSRGVRKDKNPRDCIMELNEIEGVKF